MINKERIHSQVVMHHFGMRKKAGEIGIEIEAVGPNLPLHMAETQLWVPHRDESVRPRPGETTAEYVLRNPITRNKVAAALDELQKEFDLVRAVPAQDRISNSVHVHINAQTLTFQQVFTWLALYFIFEELLVEHAGAERVGNLFCLRAKDAEFLIERLRRAIRDDNFHALSQDNLRYSAANVVSLGKYGSLEFRALRGTTEKPVITEWVDLLTAIKDASLEYENPPAVINDLSQRGARGMIDHVFKEPRLIAVMANKRDYEQRMYEGARLAQDFAFATKWANKIADQNKDVPPPKPLNNTVWGDDFPVAEEPAVAALNRMWAILDNPPIGAAAPRPRRGARIPNPVAEVQEVQAAAAQVPNRQAAGNGPWLARRILGGYMSVDNSPNNRMRRLSVEGSARLDRNPGWYVGHYTIVTGDRVLAYFNADGERIRYMLDSDMELVNA